MLGNNKKKLSRNYNQRQSQNSKLEKFMNIDELKTMDWLRNQNNTVIVDDMYTNQQNYITNTAEYSNSFDHNTLEQENIPNHDSNNQQEMLN